LLPRKPGRKGPVKLKGEVLEFALAQQQENAELDPTRLASLIKERYGLELHRTTVMRGIKKNGSRNKKEKRRQEFAGKDDPLQAIYESARAEALQNLEASWARERVQHYGVAGLFSGSEDFPFIVSAQSIARPAWSGKRDFHRQRLQQAYELLTNIDSALGPECAREEGHPLSIALRSTMGRELLTFTQELNEDASRYLCSSLY